MYKIGLLLSGLMLVIAGCGGGGNSGGGFEPAPPAQGFNITVTADSGSVPVHPATNPVFPDDTPFATRVVVRVTRDEGGTPNNGQTVTLRAQQPSLAWISGAPGSVIGERNGFIPIGSSLSLPMTGGEAEFYMHSRSQIGDVDLEASYTGQNGSGSQTVRANTIVSTVSTQLEPLEAITFIVQRSNIPVNFGLFSPFIGSPFISAVTVIQRGANGDFMPPSDGEEDNAVQGSITSGGVAAVSVADDPETQDVNEFTTFWSSIFTGRGAAGRSQFYVLALDQAGTAEFSVSALDQQTGSNVAATIPFNVVDTSSNGLPATITATQDTGGLYIEGSNGRTSKPFTLFVDDGASTPVLDPSDGSGNPTYNNVAIEIIDNGGANDSRLFANSASGGTVNGQSISTFTTAGQASFSLRAGTQVGTVTLRAVADAADNNVDNGVADPVEANFTATISDGQLFSLTLTTPFSDAVFANQVPDGNGGLDGTYGLTVSVQANDRQGNPVIPGTNVQFGLVDSPFDAGTYPFEGGGVFAISGNDGDPDEGRFNFFVRDETFITGDDGRVEPGDSLLLLGQSVANNRNYDLELQRFVESVTSDETLRVERRFNPNDGTGSVVDDDEIIPYIVGRAQHGAIEASAQTNESGVATVTLNYPVSQLNRNVALWAQGEGSTFILDGGEFSRTVGDVALGNYSGILPLTITASPAVIPASGTTFVEVCVSDALASPYPAATITFSSAGGGSVTVDGQVGSGTLLSATGANGCVFAEVTPTGQTPDAESTVISFTTEFVTEPAEVEVAPVASAVMLVSPSAIRGDRTVQVILTLLDGSGQPLEGVQLTGSCEVSGDGAAIEILSGPGTTASNGATAVNIRTTGFQTCESPPTGQCVFTSASGSPEGTLDVFGIDISGIDFSPAPDPCPDP
jgi:hypothetical protein